jgi:hypothetical protein
MMHLEVILTQFVFEHSLRIRLSVSPESQMANHLEVATPAPMIVSVLEVPTEIEAEMEGVDSGEGNTQLIESANTESESETAYDDGDDSDRKNKNRDSTDAPGLSTQPSIHDEEPQRSLVGTMTNLVTADLRTIKMPAGHIILLRQSRQPLLMPVRLSLITLK